MHVLKRDHRQEPVSFDKILRRIQSLSKGLDKADVIKVSQTVVQGLYDGVKTSELDDLAAQTAAALSGRHPHYGHLAGRIAASNLHKSTEGSILAVAPFLGPDVRAFAHAHVEDHRCKDPTRPRPREL